MSKAKAKSKSKSKSKSKAKLKSELNDESQQIAQVEPKPTTIKQDSKAKNHFILVALILFFGVQMWGASSYYWSDYPWDERFSWRMFSTVRSLSCQVQMWERAPQGGLCPDGQTTSCVPVSLSQRYHMVWVNLLKRGRLQVLDQVVSSQCSKLGKEGAVFIKLSCPSPEPPHHLIEIQSPTINLCQPVNQSDLKNQVY